VKLRRPRFLLGMYRDCSLRHLRSVVALCVITSAAAKTPQ